MKTPVLPLLVGLSLCGLAGAMLYAYLRKKDDDNVLDTTNIDPLASHYEITTHVTVANDLVPFVIGRAGANLRSIEAQTTTVISFREKDETHQYCDIRGMPDNVKEAASLVKKASIISPLITEELNVPQSACGKIIGRCGESLEEICRESMAKVSVDSRDRGDGQSRRIAITGTQTQVNAARALIEALIERDIEIRKSLEDVNAKREPRGAPRSPMSTSSTSSTTTLDGPRELLPPKPEKLRATGSDDHLEVFVSAVASPARFWMQLVGSQSAELDMLVENMTEYYSNEENRELHRIEQPYRLGQIVAAMFKYDSKWYRAEVVAILPNDFKRDEIVLDVYFVDYGDSEYLAMNEVFELRADFLSLRFQAIECYLAHVQPAQESDTDRESWDTQAISRFEELTHVAQWRKLVSRVVAYKERKGDTRVRSEGSPVPGVELYDSVEGRDINVATELIDEGFARLADNFGDLNRSSVLQVEADKTQNAEGYAVSNLLNGNSTEKELLAKLNGNTAIIENSSNENYENARRDGSVNGTIVSRHASLNGNFKDAEWQQR